MLAVELTDRQVRMVRALVQRASRDALCEMARDELGNSGAHRLRELTVVERKLTEAVYGPTSRRQVRTEVPGQIDLLDLV